MHYRTDVLQDWTDWYLEGQGYESGYETWEDEEKLTLGIEIEHNEAKPAEASQEIRCIACLNVDENSEIRDGDKGFAACYYTTTGNFYDSSNKRQYTPEWYFIDTVKVTNKGNNIKSTGDEAWETEYTWNKFNDKCGLYPEGTYYT